MFRVALRGLTTHKLRVLLSSLSIALGVAFISGTFVLTDSMNTALTGGYKDQYNGTDVVVRAPSSFEDSEALDQRKPVPAVLLDRVFQTPGVEAAEGSVTGFAMIVNRDGKAITREGATTQGTSTHLLTNLAGKTVAATGRMPVSAGEVAIDASTAKSGHYALGDRVHVVTSTGAHNYTLVGTATFGGESNFQGNTTAFFDLSTAQQVLGKVGQFDEIRIAAGQGVNPTALSTSLANVLPKGAEVVTGSAAAKQAAQTVKDSLSFVNAILLIFAFIAIFVGSFIIWNTFSILIAQRSRELALLRAVGATRRQVRRSVILEAAAVGLVASIIGIAAGVGLATGLKALLTAFGLTLPNTSPELRPRTIIVGLVVGVLVTVLAAMAPARRATHIPPVAALRDSGPQGSSYSHKRLIVSASVTVIGLVALVIGLIGSGGIAVLGLGLIGTFIGLTAIFPLIAKPASRLLGFPLARFGGETGQLARGNAMRNPNRTASTAAALMIGLSLVAAMGVLAASLKASINKDVDKTARAELILTELNGNATMSPAAAEALRGNSRVDSVSEIGYGSAKVEGTRHYVTPYDPTTIDSVLNLGVQKGNLSDATANTVFIYDKTLRDNNWKLGQSLKIDWPQTGPSNLRVVGTFTEKGAVGSEYLIPIPTYDQHVAQRFDSLILVKKAAGTSTDDLQASVRTQLAGFPNIRVDNTAQFKHHFAGQVDKFLALIIVLLALAIIIALLGIVNTLALSVFERTRELGLLRAVGMTRGQVRSMVRYESVIISVLGAATGIIVGIAFGYALTVALRDQGIHVTRVPVLQMVIYVVLAGVAGILAAIGPARRAANVDVLKAVVTE